VLERLDRGDKVQGSIAFRRQDDHFQFETLSFKLNRETKLAGLSSFFHDLAAGRYGKVVRAKALIQTEEGPYRFDVVFEKVDTVRFDKDIGESRVVVIGEALDKPAIEKALLGRMP
jgi:G3E family GTPase